MGEAPVEEAAVVIRAAEVCRVVPEPQSAEADGALFVVVVVCVGVGVCCSDRLGLPSLSHPHIHTSTHQQHQQRTHTLVTVARVMWRVFAVRRPTYRTSGWASMAASAGRMSTLLCFWEGWIVDLRF